MERVFSQELAETVKKFLDKEKLRYQYDNDGLFYMTVWTDSKINLVQYFITIHNLDFNVLVSSPILADVKDEKQMSRMLEFINRVNFNLRIGNWEMSMEEGEIRYNYYMNCDGITPTDGMLEEAVHYPGVVFGRYGEGILKTLFTDEPVVEIVASCEKAYRESMLAEQLNADEENDQGENDQDANEADEDMDYLKKLLAQLKDRESSDSENEDEPRQ
jgi:hypothetical protein